MKESNITIQKYDDGSIKYFDKNGNLIHYKGSYGYNRWYKYDENNNMIHYKSSSGFEEWKEYDESNNLIHSKNSNGDEHFYINKNKVTKEQWEKHYNKN